MPVIGKISVHKSNPNVYDIFFTDEDKTGPVSVSKDTFVRFGLSKGMEVDISRLEEILHEDAVQKGFDSAAIYLSYAMRSVKQVRTHLQEKGFPSAVIAEVIQRLKGKGYLDDREFARSFIKTQIKTTDKGPFVIEKLLREKGIDENTIEEEITAFPLEEQLKKAFSLGKKWVERKRGLSVPQLKAEIHSMLVRKGYPDTIIREAVDESLQLLDEDHELNAIEVQGKRAWKKYAKEPPERRKIKMKQYLFRKGFSGDLIRQYMDGLEEKEDYPY